MIPYYLKVPKLNKKHLLNNSKYPLKVLTKEVKEHSLSALKT
jgi:hypothetical protein